MCDPSLTSATPTKDVPPNYTRAAIDAGSKAPYSSWEPSRPMGALADVRVIHSIPALDQQASEAVQQWRFKPAIKDGKPVPMIATLELTFRLTK